MFYEKVEGILDGEESMGWNQTAKRMQMTADQLRRKISKRAFTFEECLKMVRASESPELLAWVLTQLRPQVMQSIEKPN